MLFAAYSIYYKIEYWGFSWAPKQKTAVWTIEAHVAFKPTGTPIKVSIARPSASKGFKVLDEDVVAPKYDIDMQEEKLF